jgi:formyl-CoA transferase/CoA:oxalate CoA-transferase
MLLGDLGADVIKIELPGRGDVYRVQGPSFIEGEATSFLAVNRNKKSLTLNLKEPGGKEIMWRLVKRADVFLENFKPGTAGRLGLDYSTLSETNPRLVYCSISGYGQTGPDSELGGYDLMAQARSGIMSVTGSADGPPCKTGVPIVDMGAAAYGALSILAAIIARQNTDRGQWIDISLLDTAVSWCCMLAMEYLATDEVPGRMGSASPFFAPYQAFRAQDGYLCVIGTGGKDHWECLCKALGKEEWLDHPHFSTNARRVAHLGELSSLIEQELSQYPVDYWVTEFRRHGLPCEPIQTLDAVLNDPHLVARRMVDEVLHPTLGKLGMIGLPFKLSDTPAELRLPPPLKGQHTSEILLELGYDENSIEAFRAAGIV